MLDREEQPLYATRYPEQVYERFEAVPTLLVNTVLFIENRELLDAGHPFRNPVVDWRRLAKAVGVETIGRLGGERHTIGASTLPTQLEKLRHSPDGRTRSPGDKLHQMISASLRAYQGGVQTRAARRQILVDYLDSLPLAAAPGHGEVHGMGDGLRVWYGLDFARGQRAPRGQAGDRRRGARPRVQARAQPDPRGRGGPTTTWSRTRAASRSSPTATCA